MYIPDDIRKIADDIAPKGYEMAAIKIRHLADAAEKIAAENEMLRRVLGVISGVAAKAIAEKE
jgi:hypothetical protein